MTTNSYPSLDEFLAAPIEEVVKVAPATLIFAAGGTRRSAELAGIPTPSDKYARWSRKKMINCFDLFFRYGIQHIVANVSAPKQYKEVTKGYREKLVEWLDWGLSGSEALADYARLGWRIHLIGTNSLPKLKLSAQRLETTRLNQNGPTVWFVVASTHYAIWEELFTVVHQKKPHTHSEAIKALYGENIPLATLLLSFGKPEIFPAIIPPLLMGQLQCYWTQKPGYDLDEQTFRKILYDYAYLRKTWVADKTNRAQEALQYRDAWEQGPTIGLGMRLGPFWYPASILNPK